MVEILKAYRAPLLKIFTAVVCILVRVSDGEHAPALQGIRFLKPTPASPL